jgi:hypothetical protein
MSSAVSTKAPKSWRSAVQYGIDHGVSTGGYAEGISIYEGQG